MVKIGFYVPTSHLDIVKAAMFDAGAGRIGQYDQCCWQVLGRGQFRPLDGSDPYIGQTGEREELEEYRVEMVIEDEGAKEVIQAMKRAHPYEEPAYDVVALLDL